MQRQLSPDDQYDWSAPATDALIRWRGSVALRCPPPKAYYVYLLHFKSKLHRAQHYIGFSGCLDNRMKLHRSGSSGVPLMRAVKEAGITFELAALWKFTTWEEARECERTMKRRKEAPRYCPICQGKPVDLLVFMRQGHWPLALFATPGKRRPMTTNSPRFVHRCVWERGDLSSSTPGTLDATNRRPAHE